eukprot:6715056-Prymnesium_polylepis.2
MSDDAAVVATVEERLLLTPIEEQPAQFEQHWLTMRYKAADIERLYQCHRFDVVKPRMRLVCQAFWVLTTLCTAAVYFNWQWFPLYLFLRAELDTAPVGLSDSARRITSACAPLERRSACCTNACLCRPSRTTQARRHAVRHLLRLRVHRLRPVDSEFAGKVLHAGSPLRRAVVACDAERFVA